jgi:hypothetical protein
MLAKLKDSRINKLATLKKPVNCLIKGSAKLQKHLRHLQPKSVVLRSLEVVQLLQRLLRLAALTQPAAAAPRHYITSAIGRRIAHINRL